MATAHDQIAEAFKGKHSEEKTLVELRHELDVLEAKAQNNDSSPGPSHVLPFKRTSSKIPKHLSRRQKRGSSYYDHSFTQYSEMITPVNENVENVDLHLRYCPRPLMIPQPQLQPQPQPRLQPQPQPQPHLTPNFLNMEDARKFVGI